jgi:hypothetical protein
MSHVKLLIDMVSSHKDDLELWDVDEIKTGTVARITKLAADAYLQKHKNQQEAQQKNSTHPTGQAPLVVPASAPLRRPRMSGLYALPPPPPPRTGEHNALNDDQALKMTAGNVCCIQYCRRNAIVKLGGGVILNSVCTGGCHRGATIQGVCSEVL